MRLVFYTSLPEFPGEFLESKPEVGTHGTVRSAAAASGLSKSTVGRMFQLFGVQPHRAKTFKLSTDP